MLTATPRFPDDDSTSTDSGVSTPSRSAASTIPVAAFSFTEPAKFNPSHFRYNLRSTIDRRSTYNSSALNSCGAEITDIIGSCCFPGLSPVPAQLVEEVVDDIQLAGVDDLVVTDRRQRSRFPCRHIVSKAGDPFHPGHPYDSPQGGRQCDDPYRGTVRKSQEVRRRVHPVPGSVPPVGGLDQLHDLLLEPLRALAAPGRWTPPRTRAPGSRRRRWSSSSGGPFDERRPIGHQRRVRHSHQHLTRPAVRLPAV